MKKAAGHPLLARFERATRLLPHEKLTRDRDEVLGISQKYEIKNVRVFGSAMRGDDGVDSDIDLLITTPKGFTLFKLSAYALELEELLRTQVDIVTEAGLGPGHRILATAKKI